MAVKWLGIVIIGVALTVGLGLWEKNRIETQEQITKKNLADQEAMRDEIANLKTTITSLQEDLENYQKQLDLVKEENRNYKSTIEAFSPLDAQNIEQPHDRSYGWETRETINNLQPIQENYAINETQPPSYSTTEPEIVYLGPDIYYVYGFSYPRYHHYDKFHHGSIDWRTVRDRNRNRILDRTKHQNENVQGPQQGNSKKRPLPNDLVQKTSQ